MKMVLLLFACALSFSCSRGQETTNTGKSPTPTATPEMTSMDYFRDSQAALDSGDYVKAVQLDKKAFDLEKNERKLPREIWIEVVNTVGAGYALNGEVKSSHEIVDYAIKQEPKYPMFYYIEAIAYAQENKEADAIKYLRLAFKYKANILPGEKFPDPVTDDSFAKLQDSEIFKKAVAEIKNAK